MSNWLTTPQFYTTYCRLILLKAKIYDITCWNPNLRTNTEFIWFAGVSLNVWSFLKTEKQKIQLFYLICSQPEPFRSNYQNWGKGQLLPSHSQHIRTAIAFSLVPPPACTTWLWPHTCPAPPYPTSTTHPVMDMEQSIIRYIYPASYICILLLYLSETGYSMYTCIYRSEERRVGKECVP